MTERVRGRAHGLVLDRTAQTQATCQLHPAPENTRRRRLAHAVTEEAPRRRTLRHEQQQIYHSDHSERAVAVVREVVRDKAGFSRRRARARCASSVLICGAAILHVLIMRLCLCDPVPQIPSCPRPSGSSARRRSLRPWRMRPSSASWWRRRRRRWSSSRSSARRTWQSRGLRRTGDGSRSGRRKRGRRRRRSRPGGRRKRCVWLALVLSWFVAPTRPDTSFSRLFLEKSRA